MHLFTRVRPSSSSSLSNTVVDDESTLPNTTTERAAEIEVATILGNPSAAKKTLATERRDIRVSQILNTTRHYSFPSTACNTRAKILNLL